MKKILIATTVPSTLASILKGQPRYLAKYFQVDLVSSTGELTKVVSASEGVPVHAVNMKRGISVLSDAASLVKMFVLLRRVRPDLVQSYTPKAGLILMLAAYIARVPVRVHTFTGLIFPTSSGFKRRLLIYTDRLICACATHVVPEGCGVKNDLISYKITRKPLAVIGGGNIAGVDAVHFSPDLPEFISSVESLRNEYKIANDDFVFCYIGRLNRDKGLKELILAFESLPERANLLIVGALDATAPPPAEILEKMKAHPRVHLLGQIKDIRPVLQFSDALVLPSYREGFPNVLLEAGAMAIPVIATNINGCNEIVEDGINGWLVPARDSSALKQALVLCLSMPKEKLRKMGATARKRVADLFERQQYLKKLLSSYQTLLDASEGLERTK